VENTVNKNILFFPIMLEGKEKASGKKSILVMRSGTSSNLNVVSCIGTAGSGHRNEIKSNFVPL